MGGSAGSMRVRQGPGLVSQTIDAIRVRLTAKSSHPALPAWAAVQPIKCVYAAAQLGLTSRNPVLDIKRHFRCS